MLGRIRGWKAVLAMLGLLSFGLMAPAASAQTTPTAPVDVVRAFTDANNKGDIEGMRRLVAPGTRFVSDPGTPFASEQSFEEFAADSVAGVQVNITSVTEPTPGTVVAAITLTGEVLPPLPHPYTISVTFTVANGQITSFTQQLSAETLADLQALGPPPEAAPGMPRSGSNALPTLAGGALALALLCLAAGVLFRRAYLAR